MSDEPFKFFLLFTTEFEMSHRFTQQFIAASMTHCNCQRTFFQLLSYQRNHSAALPDLLKGVCRKLVINVIVWRGEDRIRDSVLKGVCRKIVISWPSSVR